MKIIKILNLFFEVLIIGCLVLSFYLPWVEIVIYGEFNGQKIMKFLKFNPIRTTSSKFYHSDFLFPIDPIYFINFNIYGLISGLIIYLIGCILYISRFIIEKVKAKKTLMKFSSIFLLLGTLLWVLTVISPFLFEFPNNPATKFLFYNFELESGFYFAVMSIILIILYNYILNVQDKYVVDFHPKVKEVSLKLFKDGYYSQAVFECVKTLNIFVKEKANMQDDDLTNAMGKIFNEDKPIIKLNNLSNQSEYDEQRGFKFLYMGAMTGIRNYKAHELSDIKDSNLALEYLTFLSLLFRRADYGTL